MSARRYPWLREKARRRTALAAIRRAVREGWPIPADGRAALARELAELLDSGDLSPRETIAVARTFLAMTGADAASRLSGVNRCPPGPAGETLL